MKEDIDYIEEGYVFLRKYAKDHELFRSEEVCDAYKTAGLPMPPDKGWRDRWGNVMTRGKNAGVVKKVGQAVPLSGATHMASTALWRSNLYEGERQAVEVASDHLEALRKAWVLREITDLRALLEKAYEFGFEQGVTGKAKLTK